MTTPAFSIVVPVKDGAAMLPRCLAGIRASDLPRDRYELIVVDDGSTDDTPDIAKAGADHVLTVAEGPKGPAWARNRGAEQARGKWLVFVDADVVVSADALSNLEEVIARHPDVAAVFGAYDGSPDAPGFVSEYRNLLHRWVHLQGEGPATTFWAGLGAVRREAFLSVDGFDPDRFPRPQIEDIDLGYRLRDAGYGIRLDPRIAGTHLKRWTFRDMVRTDLTCRAIPWMRLVLRRKARGADEGTLNLRPGEKLKTALVGIGLMALLAGVVTTRSSWLSVGAIVLLAVIVSNARMFAWFARTKGLWFAVRVVPMNLLYYVINGCGAAVAILRHRFSRDEEPARIRNGRPDPVEAGSR